MNHISLSTTVCQGILREKCPFGVEKAKHLNPPNKRTALTDLFDPSHLSLNSGIAQSVTFQLSKLVLLSII